jgi:hypothetical protein
MTSMSDPTLDYVSRRMHKIDKHKEVHRFDRNTYAWASRTIEQADEWASSPIVSDTNMAVIHYTPHYLYAPSVPFEMKKFYAKPEQLKFIVMLRDPIERALSSYWFQNSHLFQDQDRGSVEEFQELAKLEMSHRFKFEACMRSQRGFILRNNTSFYDKNLRKGLHLDTSGNKFKEVTVNQIILKRRLSEEITSFVSSETHFKALRHCFGPLFRSKKLGSRHIEKGIYYDQIQRWQENFPSHNFHFISLHRFEKDPVLEYSKLIDFIFINNSKSHDRNSFHYPTSITKFLSNHKRLVKPNALTATQNLSLPFKAQLKSFYEPYAKELEKIVDFSL